jgi:hypothetical protein
MGINTIDLDFSDKERVLTLINKIEGCRNLQSIAVKNSLCRGYHITLFCKKKGCDLCRFVFDDTRRYWIDFKRPFYLTNVLFDSYLVRK